MLFARKNKIFIGINLMHQYQNFNNLKIILKIVQIKAVKKLNSFDGMLIKKSLVDRWMGGWIQGWMGGCKIYKGDIG